MRVWMAGFLFGILPAQLLTALQAPEPAATQERAAVSGTVINSITGEPVRRAEVILTFLPGEANPGRTAGVSLTTRAGAAAQAPGGIRQQSRSAVTGPDGSFRFENVEEGEYGIFIRREGMFPGRHGPGLSPQRIRVRAGVPVSGLRYALAPQAVISGRVLDEEGEPAQGVQVVAFRRTLAQGGKAGLMSAGSGAQTDDRGYFRLVNLPAGKYLPCVRFTPSRTALPEGAGRSIYVPLCYPDALTPEQGTWISVAAGQEVANIDFRLRRAAARRVSGRVLREDGTPARNVMIHMVHRNRAELPWFFTQTQDGSTPGSFLLEGVPAGSYDLVAREVDSSRPQKQPVATMHLEVGDEDVEGIELRFQPPLSLRGQVRVEGGGDSGRVAFGSLRIIAMPVGGGMGFANASAGEDGSFEMAIQFPGRYRLHVDGEVVRHLYVSSIRTLAGMDVTEEIDLTAGAPDAVVITLRPDAARITAERPKADKEEELCQPYVIVLMKARHQDLPPRLLRLESADLDGRAVFFPLPPGEYLISGACSGDSSILYDPDTLEALAAKGEKISLKAGEHKSVTVPDVPLP